MEFKKDLKEILHVGINAAGDGLISLLPADGFVQNALKAGLEKVTDMVFDPQKGQNVPLVDHSEVQGLSDKLVPFVIGLVDKQILAFVDIPFVEGDNEVMFKKGLDLELEALIRQAIADFLVNSSSNSSNAGSSAQNQTPGN